MRGTYYLKTNQGGPGDHVCNCGYMGHRRPKTGFGHVDVYHSQRVAMDLGYKAMQFNFVAASNANAVRLWTKLGFKTVGRLPKAFRHSKLGFIDALIMYKWLVQALP